MGKKKKSLIFLGLFLIFVILAVAAPGIIPVKEISCQSQFGPCRSELENSLKTFEGKSLKEARAGIKSLLTADVLIDSFDVRFKLPSGYEVLLIEKKPVYALWDLGKKAAALVDRQGYIIAIVPSTNLPTLKGDNLFEGVGQTLGEEKLFALEVLSQMFQFYQVKEGALSKDSLIIEVDDGPRVIFPLQGDKGVLISSLRLIISKLESEEGGKSKLAIIDLRYKNPVVTY